MSADRATPAARSWTSASRALHTTLGLALIAFAGFHAYQNYPALKHEEAWVQRAIAMPVTFVFGIGVLVAIVLHGLLGVVSWARHRVQVARGETTRDWGITFQLVTGGIVLAFVAYHVFQLWPSGSGTHSSVREPYARLWTQLGHFLPLTIYIAGVSALGFHLGHGLTRVLTRARNKLPPFVGRALGSALGLVLLFVFAQLVARFALGEALIPALS